MFFGFDITKTANHCAVFIIDKSRAYHAQMRLAVHHLFFDDIKMLTQPLISIADQINRQRLLINKVLM